MGNIPRLEGKLKNRIEHWFKSDGDNFIILTKEFCQGNRAYLRPLMDSLRELAEDVFARDGINLNEDLLEDLEYGIFDLIGRYSSTPGDEELQKAIKKTIIHNITDIFVDTKRRWNLNYFKITESIEELDPRDDLIESPRKEYDAVETVYSEPLDSQAKKALETMMIFARKKFRGDKNKRIAIKILESPDRVRDFPWLAEFAGTSVGTVKVTLTRIKQTLADNFDFKRMGSEFYITRVNDSAE